MKLAQITRSYGKYFLNSFSLIGGNRTPSRREILKLIFTEFYVKLNEIWAFLGSIHKIRTNLWGRGPAICYVPL
jgi:hypothetical protein